MRNGLLTLATEESVGRPTAFFHHVLLAGAWQPEEVYQPFMRTLRNLGHTAALAATQGYDPLQSVHDDANAALQAAGDSDNLVIVAHSRGAEVLPYVVERLEISRIAAIFLINSGGPKSFEPQPEYEGEPPLERYMPGFEEGQIDIGNGLTIYNPDLAEKFFYHDVTDKQKLADIIAKLRPERDPPEAPPPALPQTIRKFSIRSSEDAVHGKERALRIDSQWLQTKPYEIPGGHTPQLSQTALLARLIIRLARQSN